MINGSTLCSSFKLGLFSGGHDFSLDVFYIALYDDTADIGPDTTGYVTQGEISGPGYAAGGRQLLNAQVLGPVGGIAYVTFDDPIWSNSSLTARGALIYNNTSGAQDSVAVLDFGSDMTSNNGDFRVKFPPAGSTTALIRIM